jgi:hypothetical protein
MVGIPTRLGVVNLSSVCKEHYDAAKWPQLLCSATVVRIPTAALKSKWLRPTRVMNQWNSLVRWELQPRPNARAAHHEAGVHRTRHEGIGRLSSIYLGEEDKQARLMLENFGIAIATISALSGVFLLYNGITSSDMNQVLGGGALLSSGLVTAFLAVKSKLEWARTLKRYRERID